VKQKETLVKKGKKGKRRNYPPIRLTSSSFIKKQNVTSRKIKKRAAINFQ
jgi:hypothetical protein